MNEIFANTDYAAEAENYIFHGVSDRDEIRADVRACMIESLKEYGNFELPEDFESDVDEYTDNIMNVIENS
jgi:hypothetical protein